jgi:hypothetical protein
MSERKLYSLGHPGRASLKVVSFKLAAVPRGAAGVKDPSKVHNTVIILKTIGHQ